MATSSIVSVSDGSRLTVSDLVKNPLFIPTKLKELMENQFISEALLRNGGNNPAGIVGYREGDPTFLDDDVQDEVEDMGDEGEDLVEDTGDAIEEDTDDMTDDEDDGATE